MNDISNLVPAIEELEKAVLSFKDILNRQFEPAVKFPPGRVPVKVAARVYGESECYIRAGIIAGWLPIGKATRNGKEIVDVQEMDSRKGRISYYISPKLLYEQTGYLWKGEKE